MFFTCVVLSLTAQNGRTVPVEDVLNNLENRFQISFSYADSTLVGIQIKPPTSDDIESILANIESQSFLQFEWLSGRFIAIRRTTISAERKICGFVFDRQSGLPVKNAVVQSKNSFSITDANGSFMQESLKKNDSIIVRILGYKTSVIPIVTFGYGDCQKIYLDHKITTLDQVIITNYITKGITKKMGGIFTIDTKELGMLPGMTDPDVLHSMQSLPGIHSFNETVSNINIRGGTNDQNLIRWNGIRMYQSGHFFGLISAFNPYLARRVDVIKNGTNAALGNSVSGTIDIVSDKKIEKELSGTAGINMINGDALIKIPISKRSAIHISARHSFSGIVRTPTYNQYFKRAFRDTELFNTGSSKVIAGSQFDFLDASVNYLLDINATDKLQISFLNIQNKLTYTEEANMGTAVEQKTSSLKQKSIAGGIFYRRQWNPKFYTSLNLNLSSYDLSAVNFDVSNNQQLTQENQVLDLGAHLQSGFILSDQLDFQLGYQVNEIGITNLEDLNNPNFRRLQTEVLRTHALYGQGTVESTSGRSVLTLGSRVNYLDKFHMWLVEPRLSFTQTLSQKFSIELLGELKSQTTSQIIDFQSDFLGVEKRRWVLSNNSDIPVIKSKQLSIGMDYKNKNWLLTLEAYHKYVNSIITSSQGFQNQFQFVRSPGDYRVNGLDFLINKKFKINSSWISYAIAQNEYTFEELQPVIFPNNLDITHSLAAGTSFTFNKWETASGLSYRTGKPFTVPVYQNEISQGAINYDQPNDQRLNHYLRLDFSTKYHFYFNEKIRGQVGFSIWNILNRNNTTNIYYQLNPSDQVRRIDQKALNRTFNVSFRVNF